MGLGTKLQSLVFDVNRGGNLVRQMWDRLENVPGGRRVFSKLLGQVAPYTGSIDARIVELRRGYARVVMDDRRPVRNHLNSVHAVALVNLAEIAGNVGIFYAMPDDARFIVEGLSIEYLKKARGRITAESHAPIPASSERMSYDVPVSLTNEQGEEVARATLKTLIGPKQRAA